MQELITKAQTLLESGTVQVVIGYGLGSSGASRPVVVKKPEHAKFLVWEKRPAHNLAVYVTKPELKRLGRIALVAPPRVLRSLLQLAAEKQINDGDVLALTLSTDGQVQELAHLADIEAFLATVPDTMRPEDREAIKRLTQMSVEERRAYFTKEFERCIKCYACRNSCPMCYCERCTMDVNRPQWVPVASHALGNLEYHLVRAMHLAGRCIQCGACGKACPVGIPVHLLTIFAEESVRQNFGQRAGANANLDYALSTFKPDDKETFIR
jgi:ferredoxin